MLAIALVLLPVGNSWTSLAASASVDPGVLITGAAHDSMSVFAALADVLRNFGIKPLRQPWQPTGVDYGNTRVPRTMESAPICLAWQYKPKKLAAVPPGVNVLSPTWFYVEKIGGKAVVNDIAHLQAEKVSSWEPVQYIKTAHDGRAAVWATVVCIGTPDLAKQVVTDAACRSSFISRMAGWVQEYGLDGVCFDFEKMDPADKEGFTAFIAEFKQALPPSVVVTVVVTVPLKNPDGNWWQCYDREGLGHVADYVAVMTYDAIDLKPTAAIDWVRGKIKDMLEVVPSGKVLLGVPFYGSEFQVKAPAGGKLTEFPDAEESDFHRNIFPASVQSLRTDGFFMVGKKKIEVDYWIDKGTWSDEMAMSKYSFAGKDGLLHLIYCEDERSLEAKGRLLSYERLGGVAVWRMEYGLPPLWKSLFDGMAELK